MSRASDRGTKGPTNRLVERNIAALLRRRDEEERRLGWQDRLAVRIGCFTGSMTFVWIHLIVVSAWILVNLGALPFVSPFDPTFVILAMLASVEAIFLSTFVLITQNRMQAQADKRADLNLQISLLSEHELTRVVEMVTQIGERLNIPAARHADLGELAQDVRPEDVLETMDRQSESEQKGNAKAQRRRERGKRRA